MYMIHVRADLNELCDAYAMNNEEIEHYLDVETGAVIMWTEDDDELDDELEEAIGERYFCIPKIDSHEAYKLMVKFTETVDSSSLLRALKGR